MTPNQNFNALVVCLFYELLKLINLQTVVPAAVHQYVFPPHFLSEIDVAPVHCVIALPGDIEIYKPVPGGDAGFYPLVIVGLFLLRRESIVVVGTPGLNVVKHLFNELALLNGFKVADYADAPGRFEGVTYFIVVRHIACGRGNGL